jgi:hypothetical protein
VRPLPPNADPRWTLVNRLGVLAIPLLSAEPPAGRCGVCLIALPWILRLPKPPTSPGTVGVRLHRHIFCGNPPPPPPSLPRSLGSVPTPRADSLHAGFPLHYPVSNYPLPVGSLHGFSQLNSSGLHVIPPPHPIPFPPHLPSRSDFPPSRMVSH